MADSHAKHVSAPASDDALWYQLEGLGMAGEADEVAYDWLLPSADVVAQEKQIFMATEGETIPDLRPHHIGPEERVQLNRWKDSLFALKATIPIGKGLDISDQERAIRQAYHWRINENIANIRMVEAAERGDRRRFERYNTFIYGEPDKQIFAAVADWYCSDADTIPADASETLRLAAATITASLGQSRGDKSRLVPDSALSVAQEQIVHKTFADFAAQPRWQTILRRHLAVSLAQGLRGEPMNFAETYRVINAIDTMYELTHPQPQDTTEIAVARAHERTWDLLEEVYKGTDGKGIVNLRPMIYLQGNVAFWQKAKIDMLQQSTDMEQVWAEDLGKFDPTNVRHIAILQSLGILPATTE